MTYYGIHYPVAIRYSGASVMFEYEDRDDNQFSYSGGCSMVMYKRLKAIVCRVGSQELRKYSLFYTDVAGESVLDELVCTSGKTKLNPLSFSYGTGNGIEAFTTSNITTGRYYDLDDASDINSLRLIGGGGLTMSEVRMA